MHTRISSMPSRQPFPAYPPMSLAGGGRGANGATGPPSLPPPMRNPPLPLSLPACGRHVLLGQVGTNYTVEERHPPQPLLQHPPPPLQLGLITTQRFPFLFNALAPRANCRGHDWQDGPGRRRRRRRTSVLLLTRSCSQPLLLLLLHQQLLPPA
jgi:hypothetical protein